MPCPVSPRTCPSRAQSLLYQVLFLETADRAHTLSNSFSGLQETKFWGGMPYSYYCNGTFTGFFREAKSKTFSHEREEGFRVNGVLSSQTFFSVRESSKSTRWLFFHPIWKKRLFFLTRLITSDETCIKKAKTSATIGTFRHTDRTYMI